MEYRITIHLILILILYSVGSSCRSSKTDVVKIPKDLEIRIAEGGGASGMWNGYIIKSNGDILKWAGKMTEETTEGLIKIDAEKLEDIWAEINKSEIIKNSFQNPGNYSFSIKIVFEKSEYYAIWDKNSTSDEAKNLQLIYDKILNYIKK